MPEDSSWIQRWNARVFPASEARGSAPNVSAQRGLCNGSKRNIRARRATAQLPSLKRARGDVMLRSVEGSGLQSISGGGRRRVSPARGHAGY